MCLHLETGPLKAVLIMLNDSIGPGRSLIQYDSCPYKKRILGHKKRHQGLCVHSEKKRQLSLPFKYSFGGAVSNLYYALLPMALRPELLFQGDIKKNFKDNKTGRILQ